MVKSKILFLDVENSPNLSWIWGHYEQNAIGVEKAWHLLSFSAKWQGGKQITKGLCDYSGYKDDKENDYQLVSDLYDLISQADVIVAHNGDKFDIKKINTRLVHWTFTPPKPYKTVDTLKVARRHFAFNSNKLDDLGEFLGLGRKTETGGKSLWFDCMSGNKSAWKKMKEYNAQDVILLEKVYNELLPWINNHPRVSNKEMACPKCGSDELQNRGKQITVTGLEYQRYQCQSCGGWCRSLLGERVIKPLVNAK